MEAAPSRQKLNPPNKGGQNQWTKLNKVKDPDEKRRLERWRERYQAGSIMDKLHAIADGKVETNPLQIKALELMLDRLEPRLSSVEQITIEPPKDEAALMDELRQAMEVDPSFREQLRALVEGKPVPVSIQGVTGDTAPKVASDCA